MTPIFVKFPAARTLGAAVVTVLMLSGCTRAGTIDAPAATADNRDALATQAPEYAEATSIASPFGDYLAGMFANRQRDLSAAADYLARALEDDPDNPALLHQTFMLMATEGRMAEARRLAQRLTELRPSHGPATLLLVLDQFRAGELEQAGQLLDRLPDRGLSSLTAPLLGAWAESARGNWKAGMARLEDLKAVDGFSMLGNLHAALIADMADASEEANQAYEASLSEVGSPSLRLAWLIGNFHERQGNTDKAVALYRRYLAEDPGSPVMEAILAEAGQRGDTPPAPAIATPAEGISEALFNLAGLLDQQGATDIALVYIRYALHMRPDFTVARILVGEILQSQNRHEAAIEAYRKVDTTSPFHYVARLREAESLETLERDADAIDLLERVAAEHPDRYEPLYRIGNLLRSRERFAEADEAYSRALARIDEPAKRHWTLYYFRGIALERTERWPEAEEHLLKALELQPQQPYVMNYLAYSWVEQKSHLDRALDMLKRAVELRPEDGYIVDSLGWAHYRLGHYAESVDYLERAAALKPADPVINDHLGDAYWRVGRRQEARFQWHRALSLEPEPDVVSSIEGKLEDGLDAADQPNG
ncbi:tetratricopeptide repeat protein [Ferruginivarius sediminum]|uniref:Tetratricopeptide repeat protein n=1 Tax=Ferruginivarius sediminum TaxID=2661937 RepID=A0A369T9J8_9PROT|nr:tetratricopeptide repeat protein [Ferruginivarius sediminum]RDD61970.1 tetratricopeptide repeat protein [Ferruginivarius sediminum]